MKLPAYNVKQFHRLGTEVVEFCKNSSFARVTNMRNATFLANIITTSAFLTNIRLQ